MAWNILGNGVAPQRPAGDWTPGAICSLCGGWYRDFDWYAEKHDCPTLKPSLDEELSALRRRGVAPA